jgi:phosphoribosylformylglycinamidine synthase
MNKRVGIIRYPGSNCDIETMDYFGKDNSMYIWHTQYDINILNDIDLLVLPGGFAFGDRIYDKATGNYTISPGTMALNSPVTVLIKVAVEKSIPIIGICNGFQILTQLNLLPGKLELNPCQKFMCKKVQCIVDNKGKHHVTELCIANSYGKYVNPSFDDDHYKVFLKYNDPYINGIAGICDSNYKIFGMMPHPERSNYDFKHILFDLLFNDKKLTTHMLFDKCIKDLMFSEHISYKTSRKYLKNLHVKEDWVVQGPGENAGIVDIGKSVDGTEYCIAIRIESHNHPTFIDPFEGAATGVGGILRDIFTMGARPIGILDFLRFGNSEHSDMLLNKAIEGISYYGNCIGVPNIGGDLYKHDSYIKNPLVNVACLGIVKKENIIYGNALTDKSVLIYVGSKTGNEGINGAAMASNTFDKDINTESLKSNIQKSDPFLEKLLLEACCEISELGLVEGMQDMGAGGLLCATLEVVKRGREKVNKNFGCNIYLKKVPVKYEMELQNILISESQERMLIVCQEENVKKIFNVFKKWDLEYSTIGETTLCGHYNVYDATGRIYSKNIASFNDIHDYTNISLSRREQSNHSIAPLKINQPNLWECYDSTIGNRTLKGSDKPGSYSVLNIHEVNKQLILTWGESFDECYNTMKSFEGIKPLCIVNCLNFGDPKYCMYDFKNVIETLNAGCKTYNIPIVGGNVSLYNSTGDSSIRPTPILVMMGISV